MFDTDDLYAAIPLMLETLKTQLDGEVERAEANASRRRSALDEEVEGAITSAKRRRDALLAAAPVFIGSLDLIRKKRIPPDGFAATHPVTVDVVDGRRVVHPWVKEQATETENLLVFDMPNIDPASLVVRSGADIFIAAKAMGPLAEYHGLVMNPPLTNFAFESITEPFGHGEDTPPAKGAVKANYNPEGGTLTLRFPRDAGTNVAVKVESAAGPKLSVVPPLEN